MTEERKKALTSATSIVAIGDLWCGSESTPEIARELIAAEREVSTLREENRKLRAGLIDATEAMQSMRDRFTWQRRVGLADLPKHRDFEIARRVVPQWGSTYVRDV